jgi:hypothetical protein
MKTLILVLGFISIATFAQTGKPERIKISAGAEVKIDSYSEKSDTFVITLTHETAQGPNVTTTEWLQKALEEPGTKTEFIRSMTKDKDSIYHLKKPLPLLWENEIPKRTKK